ncbi:EamA family transporter [Natrarchaeobaculum aegyptiacum]|uniref:EamA domain-containing protein n=1 Tax=Natrarchaeobaculum aegyptiacum TaxID=745377 RepID=A0A2Z2HQI1_9EURY|nr:EamA family transporter [Natrarchaeobaculum aegyptiacum]ARS89299.1 hypothetical protein B1756_05765 [Natrarchaeobaculum aegyptiacum]
MLLLAGVVLAVLAAFGLACQSLSIRLATREGATTDVLFVVMLVNVVVLVPVVPVLADSLTVTPTAVLAFTAAGVVGTILGRLLFYSGIKRVGASRAEPIKASMPLHATVLAAIVLGEHVSGPQLAGVLLIVVGIALVSWEGSLSARASGTHVPRSALALPLAAAFFFGLEPIFATVGLEEGTDVFVGLAIKTVTAFVAYAVFLRWRNQLPTVRTLQTPHFHWYVLAGLANTGFLLAYYTGLEISRVSIVVPIMQTSPLIVIVLSAIFLRRLERVTLRLVGAATVIVAGAILVTVAG